MIYDLVGEMILIVKGDGLLNVGVDDVVLVFRGDDRGFDDFSKEGKGGKNDSDRGGGFNFGEEGLKGGDSLRDPSAWRGSKGGGSLADYC